MAVDLWVCGVPPAGFEPATPALGEPSMAIWQGMGSVGEVGDVALTCLNVVGGVGWR